MIIIPDKFIFLETPRTGSKSCRAVLSQYPGAILSDECHVGVEFALGAKFATSLPLVTVTRDPVNHLRSWYLACSNLNRPLCQFVRDGLPIGKLAERSGFHRYVLNPYRDIADRVFRLEDGLDNMFLDLAFNWIAPAAPMLNAHDTELVSVDDETESLILTYFYDDVAWLSSLKN
jgi:hypothetical protein